MGAYSIVTKEWVGLAILRGPVLKVRIEGFGVWDVTVSGSGV